MEAQRYYNNTYNFITNIYQFEFQYFPTIYIGKYTFHVEHSTLQSQVGGAGAGKEVGEERVGQTFFLTRQTFSTFLQKVRTLRRNFCYIIP